jgi:hypothetical protein
MIKDTLKTGKIGDWSGEAGAQAMDVMIPIGITRGTYEKNYFFSSGFFRELIVCYGARWSQYWARTWLLRRRGLLP